MVNALVKATHYNIDYKLQQICHTYWCDRCPYSMKNKSTVVLNDDTEISTGCAQVVLRRVFESNESREDIK